MTLLPSLLRQLENPTLSLNQRAEIRCQLARGFEDKGEYEDARQAMSEFWQRIGDYPKLEGLAPGIAAEVLLRAGVLTGLIGYKYKIASAQETAKNLLSESISLFESLKNREKVLEAQIEAALCYWRAGDYDEARIILKELFPRLKTDDELKAKALLRLAIVEHSTNRLNEEYKILIDNAPLFEKITNPTLKGSYHNNLANLLENMGKVENREDYTDRAFVEYAAASYYFEQAGHKSYRANVENNLGYLYFKAGDFKAAHEHVGRACRILSSLKDKSTLARFQETHARIFLAEGRNAEAEKTARASVMTLEQGGRQDLLAEALITHGTALARLRFYSQAYATLQHAIEVAQQAGALEYAGKAALILMEELGEHLSPRKSKTPASNSLVEEMQRHEHQLIKRALITSEGSVTYAARMLGVSHQRLIYLIEKRHKDLLPLRIPAKRRRKAHTK
ncbi:MAG: hypothetical protein ICV60_02905 [Pyrinomonadaceae bacterium]|nr:hypothetical protein [Pyrinomonadaceae bacterium]